MSVRLEWNRPRRISADLRGLYTKAIRDPARQLDKWISLASWFAPMVLKRHNEKRGAAFVVVVSDPP